jgi:HlyD family secretion protein
MNNQRGIMQASFWLLLLVVFSISGYWLSKEADDDTRLRLEARSPLRTTIEHKSVITGTIAARNEVKIKAQVNGVLEAIYVEPGQWVKAGTLIAQVHLVADPVNVNEAHSQVKKVRLEFERAAIEQARSQRLHEKKLISNAEFQNNQLTYDISKETLAEAKRALDLKSKGASDDFNTSSTKIYATIDGMVLERPVEVGDFVIKANDLNEGTTIITLSDMNRVLFKGDVEELDAGRLREGMSLFVTIGALPEQRFEAVLEKIAPKARKSDQGRITFEIRAALRAKRDVFVRAGYSATAKIVFDRHENVLAIPESQVVFHEDKPFVRVATRNGYIEERAIKTGLSDGLHIEVIEGVDEHDRIVSPEVTDSS